jgi:hypothetical protein
LVNVPPWSLGMKAQGCEAFSSEALKHPANALVVLVVVVRSSDWIGCGAAATRPKITVDTPSK